MTRLLDRYVLGIFLPALVLFTVTLLFLFIAVDFASKLGKFLELTRVPVIPFVTRFYLVRIPMLLVILIPSVLLFAPTFTVIKLARANEILPIAASGISLRRMSVPFLVAAVLGSFAMAATDEFILPKVGDEISSTEEILSVRTVRYNVEDYDGATKMFAKEFAPESLRLTGDVRFTLLNPDMKPVEIVLAEEARWDLKRKRWVALRGTVENPFELVFPPNEKPHTRKYAIPAEGYVVECKLKPDNIRRGSGLSTRFSFVRFKSLVQEMRKYPHVPSAVLKVHSRISFPLSSIVLVLVGLPFVMDPNSKSFVKGLIFSFLLAVGYYMTHFACEDLGNMGSLHPIVAAWFPIGTFGAAGLVAFSRMKT
ncbi:MAG TPA: LptF/LptG family permease [Planctomycetota bacterium]|nr:LptF/LptG family permease [Planctomycetota bacterium]